MITEAEAMRKTCALLKTQCHGSGCMQWRWKYDTQGALQFEVDKLRSEGFRVYGWKNGTLGPQALMGRQTEFGYCGLAGEPLLPAEQQNVVPLRAAE